MYYDVLDVLLKSPTNFKFYKVTKEKFVQNCKRSW